jgi:hypothetical protein
MNSEATVPGVLKHLSGSWDNSHVLYCLEAMWC